MFIAKKPKEMKKEEKTHCSFCQFEEGHSFECKFYKEKKWEKPKRMNKETIDKLWTLIIGMIATLIIVAIITWLEAQWKCMNLIS